MWRGRDRGNIDMGDHGTTPSRGARQHNGQDVGFRLPAREAGSATYASMLLTFGEDLGASNLALQARRRAGRAWVEHSDIFEATMALNIVF